MPFFFSKQTKIEYWQLKGYKFCLENPKAIISEKHFIGEYWVAAHHEKYDIYWFLETREEAQELRNSLIKEGIEYSWGKEIEKHYSERFVKPDISKIIKCHTEALR